MRVAYIIIESPKFKRDFIESYDYTVSQILINAGVDYSDKIVTIYDGVKEILVKDFNEPLIKFCRSANIGATVHIKI